jgi:hypothetical protein
MSSRRRLDGRSSGARREGAETLNTCGQVAAPLDPRIRGGGAIPNFGSAEVQSMSPPAGASVGDDQRRRSPPPCHPRESGGPDSRPRTLDREATSRRQKAMSNLSRKAEATAGSGCMGESVG